MPGLLEKLVARYKSAGITFPSLKPVTLAQWLLESGRATSRLATEHLNFAGLKWRSEMVGYAAPVEYEASDGVELYCKFAGLDAFIVGYWKFLSRSPYHGWEDYAAQSPEAFFRFIGPIFNPAGATYVNRVLALVPEANTLLAQASVTTVPPTPPATGSGIITIMDPEHPPQDEPDDAEPPDTPPAAGSGIITILDPENGAQDGPDDG